ncbi:hypothetical protein ACH4F6_04895 [Streptomyces sp. NPDC017936]|uniref:hypothetical protein n=1 Tax=Streptomyces sp. NPDC017936 TaxID=3365016 RepID=UPI0037A922C7
MRRTARVLSVAALAGAVLTGAAPAALADPTAETAPATAAPDGSVTVSVRCDPLGAPAPKTMKAASEAFVGGTVQLSLVPGGDELSGPAYRGTARIAPAGDLDVRESTVGADQAADTDITADAAPDAGAAAGAGSPWTVDGTCPAPPGGRGVPWRAALGVLDGEGPAATGNDDPTADGDEGPTTEGDDGPAVAGGDSPGTSGDDGPSASEDDGPSVPGDDGPSASGDDGPSASGDDGPSVPGGDGPDASEDEGPAGSEGGEEGCAPSRGPSCDGGVDGAGSCGTEHEGGARASCAQDRPCPQDRAGAPCSGAAGKPCPRGHDDSACATAPVQRGVHAGTGGTFDDSVPALVAGGLLIAGAFAAAAHRLCRRSTAGDA